MNESEQKEPSTTEAAEDLSVTSTGLSLGGLRARRARLRFTRRQEGSMRPGTAPTREDTERTRAGQVEVQPHALPGW